MFNNYLKIALRNLRRYKGYSFINIVGLALGISVCIIILLYIVYETSYDNYHKYKDRIYRVSQVEKTENHTSIDPNTAPPLALALKENYPEVESAARIIPRDPGVVKYNDKVFYEDRIMYADQEIFDILTIPFLKGNQATSLERPGTMVISKRIAEKYFGTESPVGKTIRVNSREFEITGVVANSPKNTHLTYDLIMALKFEQEPQVFSHWMWHVAYSYIKLAPNVDVEAFEKKMSRIGDKYAKELFDGSGYSYTFFLQPVSALHLYPCPHGELETPGDPLQLYIFTAVGVLVLLIACMNFVNLTTARSSNRAKEIGMRKVLGAQRLQLVKQFLSESMLMTSLAFFLALMLVELSLPFLNKLISLQFMPADLVQPKLLILLVGLFILIGIGSGYYPAFFLSTFKPVVTLKNKTGNSRGAVFRKVLVVAQFAISIILIIGTLIIKQQLGFMKNQYAGFDKEQKLIIPVRGAASIRENYESVKSEFLKFHKITGVSVSSEVPGQELNMLYTGLSGEADEKRQSMDYIFFDQDFISHFNIRIIAGRDFKENDVNGAFIINESAVVAFGWDAPEEALNRQIETGLGRKGEIVGVVKNFHYKGLQKAVGPLIMDMYPRQFGYINLTVSIDGLKETIASIKNKWHELFPDKPFEYFFLNEEFNHQYLREDQVSRMTTAFTFLGIFIACLGLFGLALFIAEQRTKEIGVRKVLGASVAGIIGLLTKDFTKWVLIANIIAWPIAYYVMNKWLQNFAYRINLEWWTFVLAGLVTLVIALMTVIYHSIKAAVVNPVKSLRYE